MRPAAPSCQSVDRTDRTARGTLQRSCDDNVVIALTRWPAIVEIACYGHELNRSPAARRGLLALVQAR